LRIFFDPVRFKAWRAGMGPMDLVYLNPYDIEVILARETQLWGLFLAGKELYMNLETDEVYEIARFEIRESGVWRTA